MKKVIVHIEGGLVQSVSSLLVNIYDTESKSIIVVDTDLDGIDPEGITTTIAKDGAEIRAAIYEVEIDTLPLDSDTRLLIEAWQQSELEKQ